jgi:hypothetical protein
MTKYVCLAILDNLILTKIDLAGMNKGRTTVLWMGRRGAEGGGGERRGVEKKG